MTLTNIHQIFEFAYCVGLVANTAAVTWTLKVHDHLFCCCMMKVTFPVREWKVVSK